MQRINLINVDSRLQAMGIDLNGDNEKLTDQLLYTVEIDSWSYSENCLVVNVPDGITIPDMSAFGEVESIDVT